MPKSLETRVEKLEMVIGPNAESGLIEVRRHPDGSLADVICHLELLPGESALDFRQRCWNAVPTVIWRELLAAIDGRGKLVPPGHADRLSVGLPKRERNQRLAKGCYRVATKN